MSLPVAKIPVGKIDECLQELSGLEESLADPALVKDQRKYAEVTRQHKRLSSIANRYAEYEAVRADLEVAEDLIKTTTEESESQELQAEAQSLASKLEQLEKEILEILVPGDPDDHKNVIVEIRGAEGGEEANLFAKDLFKMYQYYAAKMGWTLEPITFQESPQGGYGEVIFLLKGEDVWRYLKYEGGPHRVQRVPDTESQGRIHTSSATVSMLPEVDEVEVKINENDLEIDVYRSSGPGGQSVNTTDSAVRITHKPTGITVNMQDEKSQLQNRNKAMQVLRARIYEVERERQERERSEQRRGQVKSGGRSEKVRTYNFKDNRVTDHRIGLTLHKLDKVLAGDMDELLGELIKYHAQP